MNVEVWTKGSIEFPSKMIWIGKLNHIPRVGESIYLNADWCAETVERVYTNLETSDVSLFLTTLDPDNEYPIL